MSTSTPTGPPIRRRPRDRRASILTAAADAFSQAGYHGTSMTDIATAVGISSTALYRHFRNKQELLGHCLMSGLDATVSRLDAAAAGDTSGHRVFEELVVIALELRGLPRLWQLEFRNLTAAHRYSVLIRAVRLTGYLRRAVRAQRPELPGRDAELLSWCILSVAVSPSYHRQQLPTSTFTSVLDAAILRLLTTELPPGGAVPRAPRPRAAPPQAAEFERAVRPERLIGAAARLFNSRGYAAVGIEDIGAAVGVSGPALYHHFSSKADLLNEIIVRNEQWIGLYTARALAEGRDAREAVHLLMESFVGFALEQPDLLGTTVSEVGHLPDPQATRYRRIHRDGVLSWARLLQSARAELTPPEARILIQAIGTVVIDAVRNPRALGRQNLEGALIAIGDRIALAD
ncbi:MULTISPECIES: TetR/AcrR family transcriptional regulator [unclassified Nocardia]|uniref:TetR/AcrR family transcriptional regulator n=1 Tax=unclassified Nocardia TaxID=2637762 RepID=UPI0033B376C2